MEGAAQNEKADIRAKLQELGAELPHHNAGLDKHRAALEAALGAPAPSGEPEQPVADVPAAPAPDVNASDNAAFTEPDAAQDIVEDLEDVDHTNDPSVVSASPPRPHEMIVAQLQIRFDELIDFVRGIEGEIDGDLGELLTLIRSKLR